MVFECLVVLPEPRETDAKIAQARGNVLGVADLLFQRQRASVAVNRLFVMAQRKMAIAEVVEGKGQLSWISALLKRRSLLEVGYGLLILAETLVAAADIGEGLCRIPAVANGLEEGEGLGITLQRLFVLAEEESTRPEVVMSAGNWLRVFQS
jgi:hypothetical protein